MYSINIEIANSFLNIHAHTKPNKIIYHYPEFGFSFRNVQSLKCWSETKLLVTYINSVALWWIRVEKKSFFFLSQFFSHVSWISLNVFETYRNVKNLRNILSHSVLLLLLLELKLFISIWKICNASNKAYQTAKVNKWQRWNTNN